MSGHTFRSGKFAGVALDTVPRHYLEWAYVNLEAMSPKTRMEAGLLLTNYLNPSIGINPPSVIATAEKTANPAPSTVAPDMAEQVMQSLEWYAKQENGEQARAVLTRLYARKAG
jgi:hypothetical protein